MHLFTLAAPAAAAFAALTLASTAARAGDPAAAEALFDDGKRLMAQGRYDEACPKLEESQRADPGIGTQYHLADCWQNVGRDASAWALFREIESEASALGQFDRERVARDRAAALEPRLPRLVVSPHGAFATPSLQIRRDGQVIGREQWGVAVPVDPGVHTVTVAAPGKRPWEATVTIAAPVQGVPAMPGSPAEVVTVDVPPLADVADVPAIAPAPARVAQAPAAGVASPMAEGPPEMPVVQKRGGAQRALGWFWTGAGVAGLGAGAYFTVQLVNERDESAPHCAGGACDAEGQRLRHDAGVHEITAIATAGAGGLGILIGALLVATAPETRVVPQTGLRVGPIFGPGVAGLDVRGGW